MSTVYPDSRLINRAVGAKLAERLTNVEPATIAELLDVSIATGELIKAGTFDVELGDLLELGIMVNPDDPWEFMRDVLDADITLAMIEGTEVITKCGERFVPTVQIGTSGLAHAPAADTCRNCDELGDLSEKHAKAREARNAAVREMRALEKQYRERRRAIVESLEKTEVTA